MIDQILNDRYRIVKKLGEGAMGQVYLAKDIEKRREVAIKLLRNRVDRATQKRFTGEFRAISAVIHENCIKVYDFGETPDCLYFTMEFFPGEEFTALRGQALETLLSAFYQAASAIEHVHSQGIVHRDVKPSNILARLSEADTHGQGRVEVKLVDFGLARFSGFVSSVSTKAGFVGTLKYCAPEQLHSGIIDHRVDLYALGAVCYETLVGYFPFGEGDLQGLIKAKLTEEIPGLAEEIPSLPKDVSDLIMALISKNPADRPHSAGELCQVLAPYVGKQGKKSRKPLDAAKLTQSRFMGRSKEVRLLRDVMHDSLSPHAHTLTEVSLPVIFITGDAGIGKSELLKEAGRLAQKQGAGVYDGRSFRGNLSPYQPFVEILRQILREAHEKRAVSPISSKTTSFDALTASAGEAEEHKGDSLLSLRALIEDYCGEILRIAPDLRRWLPGEAFKQVDPSRETNYVLRAVANFFVELATFHGTCLLLEDLQWADQSTLDLLRHVVSSLNRSRELSAVRKSSFPRIALCCTARSEDAVVMQFIEQLRQEGQAQLLELGPFTPEDVRQLIGMLLSSPAEQLPEPLAEALRYRSQGNPFFLTHIIRAWQADGRIVRSGGQWSVPFLQEDESAWPDSIRALLRTRLGTLSEPAGKVLWASAVIGSRIDMELLRLTCGVMPEEDFLRGIEELVSQRILVEKHRKRNLEFSHDLMHELAYEELSAMRRHVLHRNVGELLESRRDRGMDCSPDLLAFHFSRAAIDDKALGYLIEAAEAALKAYAADDAIRHLEQAEDLVSTSASTETQLRVNDLLGAAHSAAGHTLKAIKFYEKNFPLPSDAILRATTFIEVAELQFRIGDYDAAVDFFDRSLREIGRRQPGSIFAVIASILFTFSGYFLPRWFRIRRPLGTEVPAEVVIERDVYRRLPFIWAQRDMVRTVQAMGQQWLLSRRIGQPADLARAYGLHALFFGIFAVMPLAKWAGDRAMEYARRVSDPEVEAVATGQIGCGYYSAARLDEAETALWKALKVLDRRGDSFERAFFFHHLRHLYAIRGDNGREIECAEVERQIGESVGHLEGECWGCYGLANAFARSGEFEQAHACMRRAMAILDGKKDIIVVPTALQTYGFVHLQSGEFGHARLVLEESVSLIERNYVYLDYAIRAYPLLVEALLGPAWHDRATQVDADQIRRSWRLSGRSLFWCKRLPNYLPHALRVRGRAAYCGGKDKLAIDLFERAIKEAETIGAEYDLARACVDLSKICRQESSELAARGENILRKIGAVVPNCEC